MSKPLREMYEERKSSHVLSDFHVGDRVEVVTPCCDFRFFYNQIGTVDKINVKSIYPISVLFDEPMNYKDGSVLKGFSFEPPMLKIIKVYSKETYCPFCGKPYKEGEQHE